MGRQLEARSLTRPRVAYTERRFVLSSLRRFRVSIRTVDSSKDSRASL